MSILGIGLILYGAFVTYMATRPIITKGFTLFTVIANSIWVLLSILLLVLPIFNFTTETKWAIRSRRSALIHSQLYNSLNGVRCDFPLLFYLISISRKVGDFCFDILALSCSNAYTKSSCADIKWLHVHQKTILIVLEKQKPYFKALGLDLSEFFNGTF